ncbi:hypothetical protein EJ06DRAFT_23061 [Trichodelitschia bisporula]|uniref:Uncharacterized protein n=1 Tax=Trichodelitschia bisporula TaxID=703511 RepID=A0A6G1IB66_9PEZI|nr:hypothetical protein EJ06DRAFT_23061 [Trichodelitschia bisporula]
MAMQKNIVCVDSNHLTATYCLTRVRFDWAMPFSVLRSFAIRSLGFPEHLLDFFLTLFLAWEFCFDCFCSFLSHCPVTNPRSIGMKCRTKCTTLSTDAAAIVSAANVLINPQGIRTPQIRSDGMSLLHLAPGSGRPDPTHAPVFASQCHPPACTRSAAQT